MDRFEQDLRLIAGKKDTNTLLDLAELRLTNAQMKIDSIESAECAMAEVITELRQALLCFRLAEEVIKSNSKSSVIPYRNLNVERVRQLYLESGLTQQQLSDRTKVSQSAISRMLKGATPHSSTLVALLEVLDAHAAPSELNQSADRPTTI